MRHLFLYLCTLLALCPAYGQRTVEAYYQHLDSVIADYPVYERQINQRIDSLKQLLRNASDEAEAFRLSVETGKRYYLYVTDSAAVYYNRAADIARRSGRRDWQNEVRYHQFRMLTEAGLLTEANDVYEQIDTTGVPEQFRASCIAARLQFCIQKYMLSGVEPMEEISALSEELRRHVLPGDSVNGMWPYYWVAENTPANDSLIIEAFERRFWQLVERQDVNAGQTLYMANGAFGRQSREEGIRTLCLATEYKIKLGDNTLSPLIRLVNSFIGEGDYQRANTALRYVIARQEQFQDRTHTAEIMQLLDTLTTEMQHISDQSRRSTLRFLAGLLVAFVAVLGLLAALASALRKMKQQRQDISDINRQLAANVGQLSAMKRELEESNHIKEEYIGSLFSTCSDYISKMDAFRLSINRKAKTGQLDDIVRTTSAEGQLLQDEVKEFNQSFDRTFLSIYPAFVADFNTLLREEERLSVKRDRLNTDLRVYAMIWLGVEESNKIAALLHVAPKTVYNVHARIRSHALPDYGDAARLNEAVRRLGRQ